MDPQTLATTRRLLHGVAELVLAGPQHAAYGTIRLRVLPGGFGGVALPLRVHGRDLVWDGGRMPLGGTCRELATAAGLKATVPGIYDDASCVDVDEPLRFDADALTLLFGWFERSDAALRAFAPGAEPVLWPEHFDVGITVDEVNYGTSPGDEGHPLPYAYVGPWATRTGAVLVGREGCGRRSVPTRRARLRATTDNVSMSTWTAADIPDQSGRTVVVTGANSGLGLSTARELARVGAHVVMACRSLAKGEDAARELEGVGGRHEVRVIDLADLESVRAFADGLGDRPVATLVNNAGIMNVPQGTTAQGYEQQLGTNLVGHFLLTNLLLPRITDRVVTLSSGLHKVGTIRLDDLNFERRRYNGWTAYAQSKLGDLMFAYELQRRLTDAGSTLRSMAAHPGYAATNLQSHSGGWQSALGALANRLPLLAQPADSGALSTLYAATVPDLPGGSYIGPGGLGELRGAPRTVGSSRPSHDRYTATGLWSACETMTGQDFTVV